MELYTQWPVLEFAEVKASILARFSAETGESVAHLLVKELVQTIDQRDGEAASMKVGTEADLEWVMQILNHAFSLSFANPRDYETIHAAVRIYVTWCSALSVEAHPSCPPTLKAHPDRYFRRMLDAMRPVFSPREADLSTPASADSGIRQATEMRIILEGLRHLSTRIIDEYKDEVWSQLILFLLNVNAQMLNDPHVLDDAHSPVANDLVGTLFTCWTTAALSEHIPSPAYWKTLTLMARKWALGQVSFIEHWGRHTLQLGAVIMAKTVQTDGALLSLTKDGESTVPFPKSASEAWFRLFHVFPRPIEILLDAKGDASVNAETAGLVFYLAVLAHSRLVDIILGDTKVSMDFNESVELATLWANNRKELQDEFSRSYHQQRSSSMSTTASNNTDAASSSVSGNSSIGRKHAVIIPNTISRHNGVHRLSGRNNNTIKAPEIEEPAPLPAVAALADFTRPKPGQFVHHYLKANPFRQLERPSDYDLMRKFSTTALLEVFLYILGDAAAIGESIGEIGGLRRLEVLETGDATSARSMSSVECDNFPASAASANGNNGDNKVTRRSFATSTASSTSDYASVYNRQAPSASVTASQPPTSASSMHSVASDGGPSMDGLAAGRAAAIGALCRIVCEKSSTEELPPAQLAQFYLILHKALVERDRLTLCSVLYYGTELFKLGLRGVEILLPNYLMAVDIILTESLKLRLHPSIPEVEMRHTCLQAIASIVAWPTTFGAAAVVDEAAWSRLGHGQNNVLEQRPTFLDLRQRLLRTLVHALRNESDSTNLHLALSSCAVLVAECCRHDIESGVIVAPTESASEGSLFAVSALRSIVSAICDNVAKPAWTAELTTTLAALDCLNALAGSPRAVLFAGGDMSTGSLVVTSLARFIDHQLRKPPPLHSRDLHSSVVAAYSSLAVWLSTTPELAEIESCLATVAEAIEFGLTGGRGMASVSNDSEHKPASLRVRDAADNLLNTLLNLSSADVNGSAEIVDERTLLYKFGPDVIDTTKFRHFLVNQSTLIAVYEASKLATTTAAASFPPAVIVVTRTPYALAHASLLRLKPSTIASGDSNEDHGSGNGSDGVSSSSSVSESKPPLRRLQTERRDSVDSAFEGPSDGPTTPTGAIKQFEFPAGFDRPLCQLDAAYPPFGAAPPPINGSHADIGHIVRSLESINARLAAGGGSASGERDTNNVWIQSSLGALLSEQLKPMPPVSKVNSIRNFLYDFGLLNSSTFGSNLIPLDSGRSDEFYRDLHHLVDRTQVRATQTVGIFYVREGQSTANEILDNALYLDETCADFCGLLADLGECVDVANHAHWTGHWATAYSSDRKPMDAHNVKNERYTIDGITHCLWSADSLLEVAFVMYSERSRRLNTLVSSEKNQQTTKYSSVSAKMSHNSNVDAVFDDEPGNPVASWQALRAHEAHHHHRLHPQMALLPEANNNVCCPPPTPQSPYVRRCLTVQTSGTSSGASSGDSDSSTLLKSPLNHGQHHRLYVRHAHPPIGSGPKSLSRRSSLSPRLGDGATPFVFDASLLDEGTDFRKYARSPPSPRKSIGRRRDSLPSFVVLANEDTDEANRRRSMQSAVPHGGLQRRHRSKSPEHHQPNNSTSAIGGIFKAFFARRGGKTPEPDANDGIISGEKLVTDAVVYPTTVPSIAVSQAQLNFAQSHGSAGAGGHRSLIRPTSPDTNGQASSRRSDVSQHSHVSGSSPSTAANRTKSSSTIASDCGSNSFAKSGHAAPSIISDKSSTSSSPKRCPDQRIFIVWLERIEDMYAFPTESLFDISTDGHASPSVRPDHVVLFLHPAEPGLIRIHVDGVWTKHGQPGPLVDGAVVSISALPALLRQTVASIARRRCLVEVDSLSTTFSRRRHSIQDFARKYAIAGTSYIEYLDSFIST
uniref:RALGAPB_N domain-containing protein n=1 Tax=Panagrellus redivivus TaxID=6233 RepID=A0A7E4UYX2_PANRE